MLPERYEYEFQSPGGLEVLSPPRTETGGPRPAATTWPAP